MRRTTVVTPGYLTCEISHRPTWNTFYVGLGINAAAVLLLIVFDPRLRTSVLPEPAITSHYVTLVAPYPSRSAVVTPPARIPAAPSVANVEHPRLVPPPTPVKPAQPQKGEIAKVEPPRDVAPVRVPKPATAPPMQVRTNIFDSQKSDLPVLRESARKIQTGGFGDPNGLTGQGEPNRQTLTAANVGSFDLPAGSGKGNGSGGSSGVSGRIRTSGFGDASTQPMLEARNANVTASGFGDAVVQTTAAGPQQLVEKPNLRPVQILYKPTPAYTPEARRMGVQGEVLIDVVFEASGALHVNRVVKGLGYGLDDTALAAARKIQFRPALRDGQPYDYAALVHIRFELAD